eukprot:1180561-Prorocentrum_minimum.AAC.6
MDNRELVLRSFGELTRSSIRPFVTFIREDDANLVLTAGSPIMYVHGKFAEELYGRIYMNLRMRSRKVRSGRAEAHPCRSKQEACQRRTVCKS